MSKNFSAQNLRGRSFKGQDLTGANFSGADLRSTDFSNAILKGANFTNVKAGLQKRWIVAHLIVSIFASMVSGGLAGYFGNWCALYFNPDYIHRFSSFPGLVILVTIAASIAAIAFQGITLRLAGSITAIGVTVGTIAGLAAVLTTRVETGAEIVAMAVAVTVAGASAVTNVCLWGLVLSMAKIATHVSVEIMLIAIAVTVAIPVAMMGAGAGTNAHADGVAVGVAMLSIGSGLYLSQRTVKGHPDYALVYRTAVAMAATGSTRFQGADLTDANFTQTNLKCSDLRNTVITRTQWSDAQLDRARLNHTILVNPDVRKLLVTGHGEGRSYIKCDLKGANLAGANLRNADLTGSDLSEATFESANLEQANLTQIQALRSNFRQAYLTGACIETWNIDSATQLDGIICDYVYLSNHPQERSPSSGMFAPGDFTKLYQELVNTIELIFHGNLDLKVLESSLSEVRTRYPDKAFELASLKHRGDGFVIVEVKVSESTNKAEIHSELIQSFELMAKKLENKFQAAIDSKNDEIAFYRQNLFTASPRISKAAKLVILKVGQGNLSAGFPVTLKIALEGEPPFIEAEGQLSPAPKLFEHYIQWQAAYRKSLNSVCRLDIPDTQVTNVSRREFLQECHNASEQLKHQINLWLNNEIFRSLKEELLNRLDSSESIRIILQTDDYQLRRLPLHLWDFFDRHPKAEVALSAPTYQRIDSSQAVKPTLQLLAILGNSIGIDVQRDKALLQQKLPDIEITFLDEPQRQDLNEHLWEQSWDILFFAGHSSSQNNFVDTQKKRGVGKIHINQSDSLSIFELRNALRKAISQGLKLAIFNSCDGLGLADDLADLHIPQTIIMKEPVPDLVAQEFLKNFLTAFSKGEPLYQCVREAREQLQGLEDRFPCATWLPIICQNPVEIPLVYRNRLISPLNLAPTLHERP
jgi:uncharacterized protein YjbI with pentapeptide repeats